MPAVPPYSSSTTASGWRAAFMRASTSDASAPSGTSTGGRNRRRRPALCTVCCDWATAARRPTRSLADSTPITLSMVPS